MPDGYNPDLPSFAPIEESIRRNDDLPERKVRKLGDESPGIRIT
jgi:hypothetical protein